MAGGIKVMNKISLNQAVILLLCCRVFRIMTVNPFENASAVTVMLSVIISAVAELLLIIPVIILTRRGGDRNICEMAFDRSKVLGIVYSAFYGLLLAVMSVRWVRFFCLFIHEAFPGIKGKGAVAFLLIVISLYGAYLGIEALGRSSVFVFVIFIIMFAIMLATTGEKLDFLNFSMTEISYASSLFGAVLREVGMNSELVMLLLLISDFRCSFKKVSLVYITVKTVLVEIILFFCTAILGNYLKLIKLPFFVLGAYSKTRLIERYDALYLIIWTLCALVSLGLSAYLVAECVKNIFKKSGRGVPLVATGALCFAMTQLFTVAKNNADRLSDNYYNAVILAVFVFVLPLVLVFIPERTRQSDTGGAV